MRVRKLVPVKENEINTRRLSRVQFSSQNHEYRYKGRKSKLSTTGFIKLFFPVFDPYTVIKNFQSKPGSTSEVKYRGMSVDEIMKKWKDDGEIAAGKGTILHEMIELSYTTDFVPGWDTFDQVLEYCEQRLEKHRVREDSIPPDTNKRNIATGCGVITSDNADTRTQVSMDHGYKRNPVYSAVNQSCPPSNITDFSTVDPVTDFSTVDPVTDFSANTTDESGLLLDFTNEPDIKTVQAWYDILTHEAYNPDFDKETGWRNFLAFEQKLQEEGIYEPVLAEVKLHVDEGISGMVDMLYRNKNTGEYLVCDWKRSKDLTKQVGYKKGLGPCERYPDSKLSHYTIQVSFYSWALRKYYNTNVTRAWIVGLHPSKDFDVVEVNLVDHLPVIEQMISKLSCDVYLPVLNYEDIMIPTYTKEGIKRRTRIVRTKANPGPSEIILAHTDQAYGFDCVVKYFKETPLHSLSSSIYVPYLDGYKERWTQDKQDIYEEGFPLNICFNFVKL